MSRELKKDRYPEWPIVRFWYTKHKGWTIEQVIDRDIEFFQWAVANFQNVTPKQAEYYFQKTGKRLNPKVIQDVEPYEWQPGDPELDLYMELCETQDLKGTLRKYRGEQLNLF